jgi:hypothetical protein
MTQDEIIKMAWDSGAYTHRLTMWGFSLEDLERFSKLIAAKEREACALIAEQKIGKTWAAPNSPKEWWELACKNIAESIRARGES